jgi:hypothetical protein
MSCLGDNCWLLARNSAQGLCFYPTLPYCCAVYLAWQLRRNCSSPLSLSLSGSSLTVSLSGGPRVLIVARSAVLQTSCAVSCERVTYNYLVVVFILNQHSVIKRPFQEQEHATRCNYAGWNIYLRNKRGSVSYHEISSDESVTSGRERTVRHCGTQFNSNCN